MVETVALVHGLATYFNNKRCIMANLLDFLVENEDGSFSMPETVGKDFVFEDGEYKEVDMVVEEDTPEVEDPITDELEKKIIKFGRFMTKIDKIDKMDNRGKGKSEMSFSPMVTALYTAGDIICDMADKMGISCCTLDETEIRSKKNEDDIAILKGV